MGLVEGGSVARARVVICLGIAVAGLSCADPTLPGPDATSNPPEQITPTPPAGFVVSEAVIQTQVSAQEHAGDSSTFRRMKTTSSAGTTPTMSIPRQPT